MVHPRGRAAFPRSGSADRCEVNLHVDPLLSFDLALFGSGEEDLATALAAVILHALLHEQVPVGLQGTPPPIELTDQILQNPSRDFRGIFSTTVRVENAHHLTARAFFCQPELWIGGYF